MKIEIVEKLIISKVIESGTNPKQNVLKLHAILLYSVFFLMTLLLQREERGGRT